MEIFYGVREERVKNKVLGSIMFGRRVVDWVGKFRKVIVEFIEDIYSIIEVVVVRVGC